MIVPMIVGPRRSDPAPTPGGAVPRRLPVVTDRRGGPPRPSLDLDGISHDYHGWVGWLRRPLARGVLICNYAVCTTVRYSQRTRDRAGAPAGAVRRRHRQRLIRSATARPSRGPGVQDSAAAGPTWSRPPARRPCGRARPGRAARGPRCHPRSWWPQARPGPAGAVRRQRLIRSSKAARPSRGPAARDPAAAGPTWSLPPAQRPCGRARPGRAAPGPRPQCHSRGWWPRACPGPAGAVR